MIRRILCIAIALCTCAAFSGCKKAPVGTEGNPVEVWFMPLKDDAVFKANAPVIEAFLKEKTGYAVKATLAPSFVAIVKAFGNKDADVAFMNTLGYLLAHDWAGATAALKYVYGDLYKTYQGEIIARVGAGIDKPADISGKTFAFADPYSAGGYLYALKYFEDNKIAPSKTVFTKGHLDAVEKVYRGEVEAAATYYERPTWDGSARDARAELLTKYPDILSKIKIVALTEKIPTGCITLRKDMPDEMKQKITAAFSEFAKTPQGRKALMELYNVTGFVPTKDAEYDEVRTVVKKEGKTIQDMVPGAAAYYKSSIEVGLE